MKSADLALYEAKRAGKNTYRVPERAKPSSVARSARPSRARRAIAATSGKVK
jgi:hypothetical protein